LINKRTFYRPFEYPWAYDMWKRHEQSHWLASEVEFRDDISDWNSKLTPQEKNLLTHLFRFFTQADIDVAGGYAKVYLPKFSGCPEITMMLSSFAAREAIHIDAYSTLIETVGMPETMYSAFMDYTEMRDKHDFLEGQLKVLGVTNSYIDELVTLAIYSGFTEGVQLFSSFAVLMNFERHNKMKGMCNIVRWSIRDESMHVEGMTRLFRTLFGTLSSGTDRTLVEQLVRISAEQIVELEDKFIDLCFEQEGIEGLDKEEVKEYIRYLANKRWSQLGFAGELFEGANENPLDWLDWVINAPEHANFFEARPTDYSKGTLTNDGDIEW
jgi:ribonucleoside-diphosphate reductase beta chain